MSTIILPEQFQDADIKRKFKSNVEYANWFKAEEEKYLQTISFKDLLQSSDYSTNKTNTTKLLTSCGDLIYVPNPGLDDYSIFDFRQGLELFLQPFVLLSLICYDVHLKWIDGDIYAVGTKRNSNTGVTLAVSFATRKIYRYTEKNSLAFVASYDDTKKSFGSSYEYLFKELRLPISIVMNSVSIVYSPRHASFTSKDINKKLCERYLSSLDADEFCESQKVNSHYMSKIFK